MKSRRVTCDVLLLSLVWWSRRSEHPQQNCDIELDNENLSLEAKICGRNISIRSPFHQASSRLLFRSMSTTVRRLSLSTNE